jgi:transcriptional regulator of met regulon
LAQSSWITLSVRAEFFVIVRTTAVVLALLGGRFHNSFMRILANASRSFESREICEEIIKKFHGQPIGEEGLLLQVRYADTPAQKDLKRITTERRQFRTNEYNIGAYGSSVIALSPPMTVASPLLPRASQIARHFPTGSGRSSGSWKRDQSVNRQAHMLYRQVKF